MKQASAEDPKADSSAQAKERFFADDPLPLELLKQFYR